MTTFFIKYMEHQELGVIFDPLYHINLACDGSVYYVCPDHLLRPSQRKSSILWGQKEAQRGMAWSGSPWT